MYFCRTEAINLALVCYEARLPLTFLDSPFSTLSYQISINSNVMDPLSITASIIAIIGAGGNIAKAIRSLASQSNAPEFVLALNNELVDLDLVVSAIQEIYQKQQSNGRSRGPQDVDINASVTSALTQARQTATELQILYQRISIFAPGKSGLASLRTKLWLLEPRKAQEVQGRLRNVRLKLAAVLGILNS